MPLDLKIYRVSNFGWYIVQRPDNADDQELYLHKDGTLHSFCGKDNFFETKNEALDFLRSHIFYFTSDEMEIKI